jgi:hypothetical protein
LSRMRKSSFRLIPRSSSALWTGTQPGVALALVMWSEKRLPAYSNEETRAVNKVCKNLTNLLRDVKG